jgi:hypothetical protein
MEGDYMPRKCERCGKETSFFKGGGKQGDKYLCFDCYNHSTEKKQENFIEREGQTFRCIYCGSSNIQKDVAVGTLKHKAGLKFGNPLFPEIEDFYADLCKDCGSIRIYVKETDRNWS